LFNFEDWGSQDPETHGYVHIEHDKRSDITHVNVRLQPIASKWQIRRV